MKLIMLKVGATRRLSPHKIAGVDIPELQGMRVLVAVEGEGIKRVIKAKLIKVTVSVASEVGSFYRRQSQVIKGERGRIGADVAAAIEDSLLKVRRVRSDATKTV